jgi:hypothetical protein
MTPPNDVFTEIGPERHPDDAALTRIVEQAIEEEAGLRDLPIAGMAPDASQDAERFLRMSEAFLRERPDRDALVERLRALLAAAASAPAQAPQPADTDNEG